MTGDKYVAQTNHYMSFIAMFYLFSLACCQAHVIYAICVTALVVLDPKEPKSSLAPVYITIVDKNDNAPEKGTGWNPVMCEKPTEAMRANITLITATDKDSALFLPINFEIADTDTLFTLEPCKSCYFLLPRLTMLHRILLLYKKGALMHELTWLRKH